MGVHKHRKSRLSPMVLRQMNPNPCEHCGGEGKVWDFSANEVEPCPKCKSPIQQEKTPLEVVMEHDCDDANLVPEPTLADILGICSIQGPYELMVENLEALISHRVKEARREELNGITEAMARWETRIHIRKRLDELERED